MIIEEKEPDTAPRSPRSRRGLLHRFRQFWLGSRLNTLRWKFQSALYDLWHPRVGGEAGSYGRRRIILPIYLWRKLLYPFGKGWDWARFNLLRPISDWWYPAPAAVDQNRNIAAARRQNRVTRFLRRQIDRTRNTALGLWLGRVQRAIFDFRYRIFGARRSPGSGFWHRLQRRFADTWISRKYSSLAFRLHDWWYPVSQLDAHSGYGRRRRSRPAILWSRVARYISTSWIGRTLQGSSFRLYEWWFPPFDSSVAGGSRSQFRRISRPVVVYRRWRNWLRRTWVGREFGWVLDIAAEALFALRQQFTRGVAWHKLQWIVTRPLTYVVAALVVAAVAAGLYFGLPHYRRYLEQQYAMQARLFLEKGDLERASLRARQALRANSENADAVGVVAEITERSQSPAALHWRTRAASLSPTPSNRLALARTALRLEQFPFPSANREMRELSQAMSHNDAYLLTAGLLAVKMADLKTAEARFTEALAANPENAEARMSLAALRLQAGDGESRELARATLQSLSADGSAGLSPLRSLIAEAFNRKDYPVAERLSTQLLTNSSAAFSDGLLHAALLKASGSTNFPAFLRDLQNRSLQHPASVGALAAWMNQAGLAAESRTWLKDVLAKAPAQSLLRVALADTYVTLKDWPALEEWLANERWGMLEHLRLAMMALAIRNQEGGGIRYRPVWERAVSVASQHPSALNSLAEVTSSWGWQEETERVLWAAATKFKQERWPIERLQQLYTAQKDTIGLRRVFQEIGKRDPGDTIARNNFASLSLLLQKDILAASAIAQELHRSNPTNAVFGATHAFALHVQGRTAEGLDVFASLPESRRQNPALAVYEGLLLAAAGQHQVAKPLLDLATNAFLLPEEAALVKAAQASDKRRVEN